MKPATLILLGSLACSCASTRERSMEFGNTVVAVQMLGSVTPGGRLMAYILEPLSLGGRALYRAAGGKEYYPSGF